MITHILLILKKQKLSRRFKIICVFIITMHYYFDCYFMWKKTHTPSEDLSLAENAIRKHSFWFLRSCHVNHANTNYGLHMKMNDRI